MMLKRDKNMHALLLACMVSLAEATGASSSERIVGGSLTTIDQYPFGAVLLFSSNLVHYQQACGCSILNNRAVLTAAHCFWSVYNINQWRIRVGSSYASSGGAVHNTNRIILHPNYNILTWFDSDLAIMHLASPIVFSNNVRAGSIAGPNYNLADNQVVWAIGWGLTSPGGRPSEQLRHVQVWTINQQICRSRYGVSYITDNMLCSGWLDVGIRDQCSQDSGGPLLHNGVIVGVCSFGSGCADPFYPGVNARVSRFTSWIQANA